MIGCDVSKSHLDIFYHETAKFTAINNTPHSISDWVSSLDKSNLLVVFEATGGYDRALLRGLEARNINYARLNPARARDFARASGVLAKTDRLDARILADMGVSALSVQTKV